MHTQFRRHMLFGTILLTAACAQTATPPAAASPAATTPRGLILKENEGERRVRRIKDPGVVGLSGPFIIKVDRINAGSKDLVMGYEELAPGQLISPHHHVIADEIIFVHRGTGMVFLGDRQAQVSAGGTVYIPKLTRISVRNNGSEPLGIVFIFSKPGFEQLMRENSVLEGQPVTPLSAAEQAEIQARNKWHTVREH